MMVMVMEMVMVMATPCAVRLSSTTPQLCETAVTVAGSGKDIGCGHIKQK